MNGSRKIISVTMEIAIRGYAGYAGGLGVLEADKFNVAARLNLPYIVIAPFYPRGYVEFDIDSSGRLVEVTHRHSPDFLSRLTFVKTVVARGGNGRFLAEADVYEYRVGSGAVLFYHVKRPRAIARLFEYLYRYGDGGDCQAFIVASAVAAEIVRKIAGDSNSYVDVQEAHLGLIPYLLPKTYEVRFVTHTPGPWGHPPLCRGEAEEILDISLPQVRTMSEAIMEVASTVFTVSRRHAEVMKTLFPRYAEKIRHVTNAIDIESWRLVKTGISSPAELALERLRLREEISSVIAGLTGKRVGDRMIIVWARRITKYKRPFFVERLAEEIDFRDRIFIMVAGKPHRNDAWGIRQAERLHELSQEVENLAFYPSYSTELARLLLSGADILLFTPFPGWEACGTSYMKAGVNGVPSIASRDGGALEMIEDGVNGWLFGSSLREFLSLEDERAKQINEFDYEDLVRKLEKVVNMYESDREAFNSISYNAYKMFEEKTDMRRLLSQYYPDFFHQ